MDFLLSAVTSAQNCHATSLAISAIGAAGVHTLTTVLLNLSGICHIIIIDIFVFLCVCLCYFSCLHVAILAHCFQSTCSFVWTRSVQKTESRFRFGFENLTVLKFDIHSDGFPTETACNPQFKLRMTTNNFTCIQCASPCSVYLTSTARLEATSRKT